MGFSTSTQDRARVRVEGIRIMGGLGTDPLTVGAQVLQREARAGWLAVQCTLSLEERSNGFPWASEPNGGILCPQNYLPSQDTEFLWVYPMV